jgi:hypothetical protein
MREVTSDSPYGKRRFAVPHHVLRFYFPALWPQAEQDEAAQTMPPPAGSAATSPRRR